MPRKESQPPPVAMPTQGAWVYSGRTSVATPWVEVPSQEGSEAAWLYAERSSYRPGDVVVLFISANVASLRMRIFRDGADRIQVHEETGIAAEFQPAPADAYMNGCQWRETCRWRIPGDMRSGAYLIEILNQDGNPDVPLGHHLIFVRSSAPVDKGRTLALVASTTTWQAYNDFGGANHYRGIHPNYTKGASPLLSPHRPWARGQVWLPDNAPRIASPDRPLRPRAARYESFEFAHANGFSRNYACSGWASYERHFVRWAEQNGYAVDIFAQEDIHHDADTLLPYRCAVFVGHCEYWSAEMRDTVHRFLDHGGAVARFAGNFLWQVRIDPESGQQTCYKYNAHDLDPVAKGPDTTRLTSAWEDPLVGRPGATTFGVNALRGIYAGGLGAMAPRGARGLLVFRPDHWALEGTGLTYADMFGDEHNIFSYEVDGLDYTFEDGLPVPLGSDGAPEGLEIVAMNWATLAESGLPEHRYAHAIGDGDAVFRARMLAGNTEPESVLKHSRGSGMVVCFESGNGRVFTAGTCEWVCGLTGNDFYTTKITKNVLDAFLA